MVRHFHRYYFSQLHLSLVIWDGINSDLPTGTKVIINLGTQQAIYTYGGNGFALDPDDQSSSATRSQAIEIAGLGSCAQAEVASLNYTVTVDFT